MNTQIHLWIEPMVIHHQRCNEKLYFNVVVNGTHAKKQLHEIEKVIEGKVMDDIMDFADIQSNWNYGVLHAKDTTKPIGIEQCQSPQEVEQKKEEKQIKSAIAKLVKSKKPLQLTNKNMEVNDGGKINITLPHLKIAEQIDFAKIWEGLEKNVVNKIKKGDKIEICDDNGNKILELQGGNFLSMAAPDIEVYDAKKLGSRTDYISRAKSIKGGLYVRNNGVLHIGDAKRTFFLQIYTNNLLKQSLKLNQSIAKLLTEKVTKLLSE